MKQKLRDVVCYACIHSTSESEYNEVFCDHKEIWVHKTLAYTCPFFEKAPHITDEFNELPIKNMVDGVFKTQKQWEKEGYRVKTECKGHKMYPSKKAALISRDNYYIYYSEDEVEKCNK